ncbi:MAG: hypothetical protein JWO31_877 [Phycisphaerales bacterium]|nr:hypothetical protein [Phycisphaerales bacterium]
MTAGHADLIARSVSCAHTWTGSTDQPHCGTCSQCVDRRLAVLAAGLNDAQDPADRYRVDLLTGHLEDVLDQTMVERIVGAARRVNRLAGPLQFLEAYGEASRLLNQLPGRPEAAAAELFKMHRTHARQVTDALGRALADRLRAGRLHDLPATSLLRIMGGAGTRAVALPAAAGTALGAADAPPDLTAEDWAIVRALGRAAHRVKQDDLCPQVDPPISRRALGRRLSHLARLRLVHRPHGPCKGFALTGPGRALLLRAA